MLGFSTLRTINNRLKVIFPVQVKDGLFFIFCLCYKSEVELMEGANDSYLDHQI